MIPAVLKKMPASFAVWKNQMDMLGKTWSGYSALIAIGGITRLVLIVLLMTISFAIFAMKTCHSHTHNISWNFKLKLYVQKEEYLKYLLIILIVN